MSASRSPVLRPSWPRRIGGGFYWRRPPLTSSTLLPPASHHQDGEADGQARAGEQRGLQAVDAGEDLVQQPRRPGEAAHRPRLAEAQALDQTDGERSREEERVRVGDLQDLEAGLLDPPRQIVAPEATGAVIGDVVRPLQELERGVREDEE